jgi:hypothetical protein
MKKPFIHNAYAIQKQAGLLKMRLTTTYKTVILSGENEKKIEAAEKLLNKAAQIVANIQ